MFFTASKILPQFIYPLGLAITALAIASVLSTRTRVRRLLTIAALLLLFAFSNWTVAHLMLRSLEDQTPQRDVGSMPVREAIVVISSFLHAPTQQHKSAELLESSDRLLHAVHLYRAGKAPIILLSGGTVEVFGHPRQLEVEAARNLLEEWGIPPNVVVLEDQSRNTVENAVDSRRILEAKGIRRIILVTSAMHMPRALAVFRKAGFDVTAAPTDYISGWGTPDVLQRWLPDAEELFFSSQALKEWIGLGVYRLRGWA
ncbi:MAG: YdcF family protein [Acidobacteriota bacterium]|nr:YdcF family protein [Acidobacteriota bacterium]